MVALRVIKGISATATIMAQIIRVPPIFQAGYSLHVPSMSSSLPVKHAIKLFDTIPMKGAFQVTFTSSRQPLLHSVVPTSSLFVGESHECAPAHTCRMHSRSAATRAHQEDFSTSAGGSGATFESPPCSAEYQESRTAIVDQQAEVKHRIGGIHLVMGSMFAGKTTELLRRMRWEVSQGRKVAVIKSATDTRYSVSDVVSHDGDRMPCIALDSIHSLREQMGDELYESLDVIGIDEGQFIKGLKGFCEEAADQDGKALVIAGLDGDFRREIFGDLVNLIPLADTVTKLGAKCRADECGRRALYSLRKTASTMKELVGGADVYMPVCRHHYLQLEHLKRAVDFRIYSKSSEVEGTKISAKQS